MDDIQSFYSILSDKPTLSTAENERVLDHIKTCEDDIARLAGEIKSLQRTFPKKHVKGWKTPRRRAEFNAIKSSVDALKHEQAQSREALYMLTSLIAPIRHIPTEILQHIFILVTGGVVQLRPDRRMEIPVPLVLAQVSSRWRQAAITLSSLWTRLF